MTPMVLRRLLFVSFNVFCLRNRPDRPRGGGGIQRLPAVASHQPPLGRSELWQGEGHGGDKHRQLLTGPQDALVAPGQLRVQRHLAADPTWATAVDLPLFGPLLPQTAAPKQPRPRRWLGRGGHSCNVRVNLVVSLSFSWWIMGIVFFFSDFTLINVEHFFVLWGRSSNSLT